MSGGRRPASITALDVEPVISSSRPAAGRKLVQQGAKAELGHI
jgi:hypothetical protein